MSDSIYKDQVDYKILDAIKQDFFNHHQGIICNPKKEGQHVQGGIVELGTWAGPHADISNLLHEMGHFVEIDQPRMAKYGWGLKFGKYYQIGMHSGHEPYTAQSVWREIRVWAYQINLMNHYNIPETIENMTASADYLPAICYVPGKTKEERLAYVAAETRKMSLLPAYQVVSFATEWERRAKILDRRAKCRKRES